MLGVQKDYKARKAFCFMTTLILSVLLLTVFNVKNTFASTVTIYPFPASLSANNDFQVWVEGSQSPVWSVPGLIGSSKAATSFSFSGPVTVKVQYKANFTSAHIMPSQYGISYTKPAANQLQFTLSGDYTKSKVIIRIDGDAGKELYLFGDPPVASPPPGATVYEAGAHYPTDYKLTMSDNQTIFLKPGAVLHARIDTFNNANLKILGPGIVVAHNSGLIAGENDGIASDTKLQHNIVFYKCNNVELRDFILVRDFNSNLDEDLAHQLVLRNTNNVTISNVKVISDGRCSDGLTLGGNNTVNVNDFFSVSGDNNLVIGWWGKTDKVNINNYISYFPENVYNAQTSAVFLQGIEIDQYTVSGQDTSSMGTINIKNLHCIKQENVIGAVWGHVWDNLDNFTLENVYCEAGSTNAGLMNFSTNVQSNKNITFRNVYFDKDIGGYVGDKFNARFDNVYYNGSLVYDVTTANYSGPGTVEILNGTSDKHYECENGLVNGTIVFSRTNASYGKAVGGMDNVGDSTEIFVTVPAAGNYILGMRYANGEITAATRSIYVNGIHKFDVALPITGGWDIWQGLSNAGTVNLNAGTNKIKIQTDPGDLSSADFDYIQVYNDVDFKEIPGKLEAENYNNMYGIGTESTSDTDGGLCVGGVNAGDWLDYTVNTASPGYYKINLRVASLGGAANGIQIKSGSNVLATVSVPDTGGWQNWQTVSTTVNLNVGVQTLRVYANAGNWNLNWMDFTSIVSQGIPCKVEAENYNNMYGIGTESTSDTGGGLNVGAVNAGDWLEYTVNVPSSGTYPLDLRVASWGGAANGIQLKSENTVLATISVPDTGGWQNWQTVRTMIYLKAGIQTLRLYANTGNWNLNWMNFIVTTIPGRLEAESYYNMYGIGTESTSDTGGGLCVGGVNAGDWLDYTVSAASSGIYTVNLRVASWGGAANGIQIKSGNTVLATASVPNTGGWQNWQTISTTVVLKAGVQNLRIYANAGGWNLNWVDFAVAVIPCKIEAESYYEIYGIGTEYTSDAGGGQNLNAIHTKDWVDYIIDVASTGTYTVNLRVASWGGSTNAIQIISGNTILATVNVPDTGGWQNWQTISTTVNLNAGVRTLMIYANAGNWNLNWIDFVPR